jgi:hypothetical protein
VVEHKLLIFVHIPLFVLLVSVVWLQVTWRYPRFAVLNLLALLVQKHRY